MPLVLLILSVFGYTRVRVNREVAEITPGKTSWQYFLWKNAEEFSVGAMIGTGILTAVWLVFLVVGVDTLSIAALQHLEGFFAGLSKAGSLLKGPACAALLVYAILFVVGFLSVARGSNLGRVVAVTGLRSSDIYFKRLKQATTPIAIVASFTFLGGTLGEQLSSIQFALKSADAKIGELRGAVERHVREHVATQVYARVVAAQAATYRAARPRFELAHNRRQQFLLKHAAAKTRYAASTPAIDRYVEQHAAAAGRAERAVHSALDSKLRPQNPESLTPELRSASGAK
jgi:hypothetical protein